MLAAGFRMLGLFFELGFFCGNKARGTLDFGTTVPGVVTATGDDAVVGTIGAHVNVLP